MNLIALAIAALLSIPPAVAAPLQSDHSHDATIHHSFEDVEVWVSAFDDPKRAEWQKPEEVVKALDLRSGMNVADIGAGTGYFNRFFAAAVGPDGKIYAADIEPKMVEHMRERAEKEKTPNVIPTPAAPDDPKLPAGAIDLIFICNTYHHIDDRLAYLQKLKGVLRPGGRIAIVDYLKRESVEGPPIEHRLAPEQVTGEFEEAGYRLLTQHDFLPKQYFLIFQPK